ncbi:hypothetical protein BF36_5397 (plasmid) [Bacillus thuringiensis]|nr:hypothetical protein BF36_5397 [Bacillus thuringiensis]
MKRGEILYNFTKCGKRADWLSFLLFTFLLIFSLTPDINLQFLLRLKMDFHKKKFLLVQHQL